MKKASSTPIRLNTQPARGSARSVRSSLTLSTFLFMGAALLGPGGGDFRAAAQSWFPDPAWDPVSVLNESMQSIAVFQVVVDPNYVGLMTPQAGQSPYPGWNAAASTLTSPVLFDRTTQIAVSWAQLRPRAFPDTVGGGPNPTDQISGYGNPLGCDDDDSYYLLYPDTSTTPNNWDFSFGHVGFDEILTEIQSFNLSTIQNCYAGGDPRAPYIPMDFTMVRAGFANVYPNGNSHLRRSLGMVQSTQVADANSPHLNDFPANSFFDIYAEVTLPQLAGTPGSVFPAMGAILTNGAALDPNGNYFLDPCNEPIAGPMIISSPLAGGLPGQVFSNGFIYVHQASTNQPFGVAVNFRDDNPSGGANPGSIWHGGDRFGTIALAGHGVFPYICGKANLNVSTLLDAVLGPAGKMAPPAIVGRIFASPLFPSPGSVYASVPGTNYDGSSLDEVMFTNGTTVLHARDFKISNFINPISLPPASSWALYTNTNAVVSFDVSDNGTNDFVNAQAVGQVQMLVTNGPNSGKYASVGATAYDTQLQSLSVAGSTVFGSFRLRQITTKTSPGKDIVQTSQGGGGPYRIGGYFDTSFEYSFNNGVSWKPANRPIRLQQNVVVDCGAVRPRVAISEVSATAVTLTWDSANYRLQGKSSLSASTSWVDLPVVSPYVLNITSSPYHYFRLVCP